MRTARGQFAPGTSGNPGGRPRLSEEARKLLEGIAKLHAKARQALAALLDDEDPNVRAKAVAMVLDRVLGKVVAPADEETGLPADFAARPAAEQAAWYEERASRYVQAAGVLRARVEPKSETVEH